MPANKRFGLLSSVQHPDATISDSSIAFIAPGQSDSTTFTATYTIIQVDLGNLFSTNTATVFGNPYGGDPVSDDDSVTVNGIEPPTPTPTEEEKQETDTPIPTPTNTQEEKQETLTPTYTPTIDTTPNIPSGGG